MDIETRLDIIKSEPTEEIITPDLLRKILETNSRPRHYIGYEISGIPHIGSLLLSGKKINDMERAEVKTQILLADWHTVANNKLGGDWEKIKKAASFYKMFFKEVCPKTSIIIGSDLYHNNDEYWNLVMRLAAKVTMARATRTLIIEGRSEKETLRVSQYIYPIMQAVDIHALGVEIPHAGMDQRKVHVLAKELFADNGLGDIAAVHHHLLPSLLEPPRAEGAEKEEVVAAMKMSKSKPNSSISIFATDEEIYKALRGAWCPEGAVQGNPVLEMCRYLIFPAGGGLAVERKKEYGGDVDYMTYADLEKDYREGRLHPLDLKAGVAKSLSAMIRPIRSKFSREKEEMLRLLT